MLAAVRTSSAASIVPLPTVTPSVRKIGHPEGCAAVPWDSVWGGRG